MLARCVAVKEGRRGGSGRVGAYARLGGQRGWAEGLGLGELQRYQIKEFLEKPLSQPFLWANLSKLVFMSYMTETQHRMIIKRCISVKKLMNL